MKCSLVSSIYVLIFFASLVQHPEIHAQESLIDSICLVTNQGRINDGTFNESTYNGFSRAALEFSLTATFIESAAQSDFMSNISTCINEGFDAVITVGFPMTEITAESAEAYPDIYFIGIDQFHDEINSNLLGLLFREDQGGFLAGAMAALISESKIIAGVYGPAIPPVQRFRDGFEQGARFIFPDIQILSVHVDSFTAPDRGATAAEAFIGERADVILGAGGRTGSGAILAAAQRGTYVIGVDQDEYLTTFGDGAAPGSDRIVTSALKRVDLAVYSAIQSLVEGGKDWRGGVRIFSAKEGGISYAPPNDSALPEQVTRIMNWIYQGIQLELIRTGAVENP